MAELYDPFDPAVQEDPYPVYRRLRDEAPIYRSDRRACWVLSRFDDIWKAVHDHEGFSSAKGVMVGRSLMSRSSGLLPMMLMMDPPRHDELRKLVSRAFTPRRMAAMEGMVRTTARRLLGGFLERGQADLAKEYAAPLPTIVIADMLGVPHQDRAQFRAWSDDVVQVDPDDRPSVERAMTAATSLYGYFGPMLAARRAEPAGDLMSALLAAEVDGRRLSEEELLGFCFLLLLAGTETTANLISNAAVVLSERPDARKQIAEDPSLLPPAIEEILRLESPVQGLARTLTSDVELHGTPMRSGEKVLLLFGSANRDEREFPEPESFIPGRRSERALAFGHGIHYCLGAALARLECRVAYEELLAHAPSFEIAEGAERLRSGPIRGFIHLPVVFAPVGAPAV